MQFPVLNFPQISPTDVQNKAGLNRFVPAKNTGFHINYTAQPAHEFGNDDEATLVYNYSRSNPAENSIDLNFGLNNKIPCDGSAESCSNCKQNKPSLCTAPQDRYNVISVKLLPAFFHSFGISDTKSLTYSEQIITFTHSKSFTTVLPLCSRLRNLAESLQPQNYEGMLQQLYIQSQVVQLLIHSLSCLSADIQEPIFTCKFLANQAGREKIVAARDILLQHLTQPITIKALSRKVMLNECYLKKGFKEVFGATIFEFYQSKRMDYAKDLLYQKGLSVTDVSALLGYSSISHFSTAFKKFTGIKPCELLMQ